MCFQTDLDEMEIILRLRGLPVYKHQCPTQGCPVTLTARNPMSVIIALPKQKVGFQWNTCMWCYVVNGSNVFEPLREETNNLGCQPGPTQTGLYIQARRLKFWNQ